MVCEENMFKKLKNDYATIHLFENYYLMRNNTWYTMCPSPWGIVKVVKTKAEEMDYYNSKF